MQQIYRPANAVAIVAKFLTPNPSTNPNPNP
jgi:hypothetical protein